MRKLPRHNLTAGVRKYREADVIFLSVAKSGRTWLRVLLNKYFSLYFDVDFAPRRVAAQGAPVIHYDHEAWSYIQHRSPWKRLAGANICPDPVLRERKAMVMFRDPRDVVISGYFQITRRSRHKLELTISEMIRRPERGIDAIIDVMNHWRRRLADHPRAAWICYEEMHRDTAAQVEALLTFLEVGCNPAYLHEAIEFARFDNMRSLEAKGEFNARMLTAIDPEDPDSFKVRRGKVGGYLDYLEPADLDYVNSAMARLDPAFGYQL